MSDSELLPLPLQLSPYPVILSLENHCGLEQQAVMACHLRTILGDMLVTQALDSQNPEELPSPEVRLPEPPLGWGKCLSGLRHPPLLMPRPCSGPLTSLCLNLPLLLPSSDICHPVALSVSCCPSLTRPTPPSLLALKAFRDLALTSLPTESL